MSEAYILVVDDEPDIRGLVKEILEDEGYEVTSAENAAVARDSRRKRRPDLVLLDIWMPDTDGISLLKEWSESGELDSPVIMMSGHGTVETAVEATRLGAYDYLEKPLSLSKLLLTVRHALDSDKLQRENLGLRRQAEPASEPIGKSQVMQKLREQLQRVAQHDTCVLLTGEPGTGKKLMARYIHENSARKPGPFVDIGVATIARENSATELFGNEANGEVRYGRLEQANGGTLFLAEVGDMDMETQGRLLAALETQSFMRVGGTSPVQVNVRIIASTYYDLAQEVQSGRFREDLYYKLNVVPIKIPGLREYIEDVPELLAYYLAYYCDRDNLPYSNFAVAAQNRLRQYAWPGNVRELENLVQRLLIMGHGEEIGVEEVETALLGSSTSVSQDNSANELFSLPLREARERFEHAYLLHQLKESGGSVTRLAKVSGMERTHLYRKLRSLGIDPRQMDT